MTMNQNLVHTTLFAEQLAKLGVKYVVIGAGSRSTPLTLAFANNPSFRCYSQVDERSAAFFALGLAQKTETPVVIISTSGTAGANFFPAVIEAKESFLPLIVLTADRPHELRISGANQTTDQVKLFGDHVNWFSDAMMPVQNPSRRLLQYPIQLATLAVERSLYPSIGPVHLNFPFRKPLEPESPEQVYNSQTIMKEYDINLRFPQLSIGTFIPSQDQLQLFRLQVEQSDSTFVILGPYAHRFIDSKVLNRFIRETGVVVFADPLSGLRYNNLDQEHQILSYEVFLSQENDLDTPDLIIQIGDMPVSKYLGQWLENFENSWIILDPRPKNTDGVLNSNFWFRVDPTKLLASYLENAESLSIHAGKELLQEWLDLDKRTMTTVQSELENSPMSEPGIIHTILDNAGVDQVFIANSLIPRHLEANIFTLKAPVHTYCNRGVSGIDGTLSSALGIAEGSDGSTMLLTGDLAFYHDMNGLLAMMRYGIPLKIVIINNQGGKIFERLPISKFDPPFEEYFLTQHQLGFEFIAQQFHIPYLKISAADELEEMDALRDEDQIIVEIIPSVSY